MAELSRIHGDDPFVLQKWQAVNSTNSSFYIRAEDEVRLSAWTTTASLTITLNGILVDLRGDPKPFNLVLAPTSDGVRTDVRARMGPGYILYCHPTLSGGTPAVGAVTVAVEVLQSDASTGPIIRQLMYGTLTAQGFIPFQDIQGTVTVSGTTTQTPSQPSIQNLAVSNPAAGADWTTTVTAAQVWEIQSIRAQLVASAAAANRQVRITLDDGANVLLRTEMTANQTANLTFVYNAFNGAAIFTPIDASNYQLPLPRIMLAAGSRISSNTVNIQAADQWSAIVICYRLYT